MKINWFKKKEQKVEQKNNSIEIKSVFEDETKKKFKLLKFHNKKILNSLNEKKITWLYLYLDAFNLKYIIENGIKICKNIVLKNDQKYVVWSFSQLQDQTNFILENDENVFWNWFYEQNLNENYIMTIAINKNNLFNYCKKNWKFNQNILTIFESIPNNIISWILIHDKEKFNQGNLLIKKNNLNIKIFYGSEGQIINE